MSIPAQPWVIVPGNHDGVHRGHQHLLREAAANSQGHPVVPLFFDPHPAQILRPEKAPEPLTTASRRVELLLAAGATHVVCERFDRQIAQRSPAAFATEFLRRKYGAFLIVVGPDFRFGHRRAGDVGQLRVLGREHGFAVLEVDLAHEGSVRISSTLIRDQLKRGDVRGAASALGRFHEVEAGVVEGQKRGRTIGFPTANLGDATTLLPADGVYAVVVRMLDRDEIWHGAANLGVRPTMGAGRSVEVHLLDFEGASDALYGKRLRVGFVDHIRNERKFDNIDVLKRQIAEDVVVARRMTERITKNSEVMAWF